MNDLELAEIEICRAVKYVLTNVTQPMHADGYWWLDIWSPTRAKAIVIQWQAEKGFGLSDFYKEAGYGEGPDEVYKDRESLVSRVIEIFK